MTDTEIITKVESLLATNRKAAIISTIIFGACLVILAFGIDIISGMFSTIIDLDEKAFWFSCLIGAMVGCIGITILGIIAQNIVIILRKGVVFRGLDLLLKYHAERRATNTEPAKGKPQSPTSH